MKQKIVQDNYTIVVPKKKFWISNFFLLAIILGLLWVYKGSLIIAVVNGEPIYKVNIDNQLEQTYGGPVVNDAVGNILIAQEATKKHILVSQKELDTRVGNAEKFFSFEGKTIDSIAAELGQTRQMFIDAAKKQIINEKLFGKGITVSNDEIEQLLSDSQNQISSSIPKSILYAAFKQEIFDQKVNNLRQQEIQRLQENGNIQYFDKFPS